jgi:hypothetical protein
LLDFHRSAGVDRRHTPIDERSECTACGRDYGIRNGSDRPRPPPGPPPGVMEFLSGYQFPVLCGVEDKFDLLDLAIPRQQDAARPLLVKFLAPDYSPGLPPGHTGLCARSGQPVGAPAIAAASAQLVTIRSRCTHLMAGGWSASTMPTAFRPRGQGSSRHRRQATTGIGRRPIQVGLTSSRTPRR